LESIGNFRSGPNPLDSKACFRTLEQNLTLMCLEINKISGNNIINNEIAPSGVQFGVKSNA